jgi:hypothetical protein
MTDLARHCRNCSTELHGEYCSACGQKDTDINVPVKELASEFIEVLPSFDRRLLRSVKPLLFDPGFLTMEYLAGKRRQYLSPFKLYFFISFLFFLVSSFRDDSEQRQSALSAVAHDSSKITSTKDSAFVVVKQPNSSFTFSVKDSGEVESLFGPAMVTALRNMKANPGLMFDKIKEHRPKIIFVLLPFFALLLKLLYIRSGTLYIKHLVFSFNAHSFLFLVLLLTELIRMAHIPFADYATVPLYCTVPLNLFFGMRNVYGQSKGKTALKLFLLSTTYGVTFLLSISLAAFIIILFFYT